MIRNTKIESNSLRISITVPYACPMIAFAEYVRLIVRSHESIIFFRFSRTNTVATSHGRNRHHLRCHADDALNHHPVDPRQLNTRYVVAPDPENDHCPSDDPHLDVFPYHDAVQRRGDAHHLDVDRHLADVQWYGILFNFSSSTRNHIYIPRHSSLHSTEINLIRSHPNRV